MSELTAAAGVKVDGDKLAEALRRVTPFMADERPPNLVGVYAESQNGILQLTALDGWRMGHLTVVLPFPDGNYLMKAAGVKDFSQRHYNGQEVTVEVGQGDELGMLTMGEVKVDLETTPFPDYPSIVPDEFDLEAIVDTKAWIKTIRQYKPEIVGVIYSSAGCRLYLQNKEGETVACESVPVQMISGPDKKVSYNGERFRRALTSCGPTATIQVGDVAKATLFEAEDYWHILMPTSGFPREVSMSTVEKEAIKWAEEALEAVRKGEVQGRVLIGGGKFYLEIGSDLVATEVIVREPKLLEEVAPEPADEPESDKDEPEIQTGEE